MTSTKFIGTGMVRPGHEFDEAALSAWMVEHVPGYAGPLEVEQFKGGQSNPTYKLVTPERSYVLRRKPPGTLLKGAHAIEREFQVLAALNTVAFPVPQVHKLCEDKAVIGTPFYIMDMVEGRILWDAALPESTPTDRRAVFNAMNEVIARLHSIKPSDVGLSAFGKTGNYLERQIARWSRQYREDDAAGRIADLDRLADWLADNIPAEQEAKIVHGDFRIDNLVFAPDRPDVAAVLDWELSTLGDPISDFAYNLMMYRMPPLTIPGLLGADLERLGIPTEGDYVASYCARTGRDRIEALDFYLAFNFFRFAAICHGIKGRIVRGTAASPDAHRLANDLPTLARLGMQQAQQAG